MVNFSRKKGNLNGHKRSKTILKMYPNSPNDTKTVPKRSKTLLRRFSNGPNEIGNGNGATTVSWQYESKRIQNEDQNES